MKYLLLTSHFSDCFSRRGLASCAYNYYSQLVYYTKKHFDWAVQVLLAYKKHLQVDYSKADFVPKCFALSTSLPSSGISSLLVKIPQITSYITSYIQVDKAIRGKFFIIGCNDLQYQDYLVPK